jgi:cell division transport system permease protein
MLRFFSKFDYLLGETFLGLRRGGWMNWAAISTMTVLLFLFGVSLQASWQLEGLLNQFGSQLEVSAYLETGVGVETLKPIVERLPQVAGVKGTTKEEAWGELIKELGLSNLKDAAQQIEGNPLVDEIRVKAKSSEQVTELAEKLKGIQGVEEVQYVDEAVLRIAQLNQGFNRVSAAITGVLSFTAIAVINTTIRLIVMARRREIEVMQLVGATRAWIYLPFLMQGMFFGIVGSAIACGLIYALQRFVNQLLAGQPEFVAFLATGLQISPMNTILLPAILVGLGSAIGLVGSLLAVRRFASH